MNETQQLAALLTDDEVRQLAEAHALLSELVDRARMIGIAEHDNVVVAHSAGRVSHAHHRAADSVFNALLEASCWGGAPFDTSDVLRAARQDRRDAKAAATRAGA